SSSNRLSAPRSPSFPTRRSSDLVRAHPHAPFGSYQVGDDVLVQTWRAWEEVSLWVRIISLSYDPETDEVAVTCRRSDSFRYGGQSALATPRRRSSWTSRRVWPSGTPAPAPAHSRTPPPP